MMGLYVIERDRGVRIEACVSPATFEDFRNTASWQTSWMSKYALSLPNKVALRRKDTDELLGLMSYKMEERALAVEILYMESAAHSNANILHQVHKEKKYLGIGKALFAYAVQVSKENGFYGVLVFRAKTSDLVEYYKREFGAQQVGRYDPQRMVIWEDAAESIIREFEGE